MDLTSKLSNLKNQLLDLAIRGKLVEQRPEDGTADELYAQIQAEKKKLIADGKIKKEKPLPEITEDEIPFEIPESWKWVRLGDIVSYGGVKQSLPEELNQDSWILDLEDIESNTGILLRKKTNIRVSSNKFCFFKGNILYGKMRPYLNKVLLADSDGFCSTEIMPLDFEQFKLYNYFFKTVLMSPYFVEYATKVSHGVNIPRLGTQEAKNAPVPLPPLAEQKRIVAKLESYLAVIDKAEELIEKKANLDEEIRNKILDLAIKGKLVEQRPEEGSAEELYTQIQEEKQKLIADGKIKKEKPLPEISEDEIPFDIPDNWKWVRLNEGMIINPSVIADDEQETSFIPMADVEAGYSSIINLKEKRIWKTVKKNFSRFEDGDVLIAKITPCFQNRKSAIAENLVNGVGAGTTEFNVIRTNNNLLLNKFVLYFAKSEYFINYGQEHFTGTVGQQRFSGNAFYEMLFPLPPLAEQKRIVDKIEELLPYCDKLK